jgi:hypothetical protein
MTNTDDKRQTDTDNSIQNSFGRTSTKKPMTVEEKECTRCNQTKNIKQFKKRLTLAQTKAFLKQPNATTRFITTSTTCKQCRAKRSKPLTIKQIRTKISTGDMHPVKGELKIKQMVESLPKRRSKVMKEYWQKKKAKPNNELKINIQKQVDKYRARYATSKNKQDASLAQNSWNYEQAKQVRKELIERMNEGEVFAVDLRIEQFFKTKQQGE